MLAVQPGRRPERQEELTAIRPRTRVRHAQEAGTIVPDRVRELAVVLVARPGSALPEGAAGLRHELGDDPVEGDTVIEAEQGQVDRARHVHRGNFGEQACLDRALVRLEVPEEVARGIELDARRLLERSSVLLCSGTESGRWVGNRTVFQLILKTKLQACQNSEILRK